LLSVPLALSLFACFRWPRSKASWTPKPHFQTLNPQTLQMAVPLPDFRPPPPKMPNRSDLSRSSWLNPSANFEFSHKQRRREFIDKYKPTLISGLPPCPPPPGALRPLPLPGEDIPGHQIRLKNLPLGCTIEMVREYMGKHVDEIMPNWTRDGKTQFHFPRHGLPLGSARP
jgi:hypothetical protein